MSRRWVEDTEPELSWPRIIAGVGIFLIVLACIGLLGWVTR